MSSSRALFDDGKDAGALRTIGEVSAATGIKPHVLRYWEDQFPSLSPLKRAGGRRLYRPEDVAMIERINALVSREGYTLKGARAALSAARSIPSTATVPSRSDAELAPTGQVIAHLKDIRSKLVAALAD